MELVLYFPGMAGFFLSVALLGSSVLDHSASSVFGLCRVSVSIGVGADILIISFLKRVFCCV